MLHTKSALALGFAASLSAALAVDMPADYTHYEWLESDTTGKQWIDTGYAPTIETVISGRFQAKNRAGSWTTLLGAFDRNDNSKNGVLLRYNNNSSNLEGIFCTDYGKKTVTVANGTDYDFVLKHKYFKIGGTEFTYADANSYDANFTTGAYNGAAFSAPLYLFAEDNRGNDGKLAVRRQQPVRFYTLTFAEGETLKRDFHACKDTAGKFGLWDAVEGVFYGNMASGADFTAGGLTYMKSASGALSVTAGGSLPAAALVGATSLVTTAADRALLVGAHAALPVTTVSAGELSFADGAPRATTINGTLTLASGTTLGFDVTGTGADALTVSGLSLGGTVTIKINAVGVTGLDASVALLSGANLAAADLSKFTLDSGVPASLEIENGNLMLAPKSADPVTWAGAASGAWSAGASWTEGKAPGAGAPVTIAGNGGTTTQDLKGLAIGSLTTAADAGSFTHGGEALTITKTLVNASEAAQTMNLPLTLGVAGKNVEVSATGDLAFNQPVTLAADKTTMMVAEDKNVSLGEVKGAKTLAKAGAGTLTLTKASPDFNGDLEITGGKVVNTQEKPFTTAGVGNEIRISNGGTLDLGSSSIGTDKLNFNQRKLVLSGEGVDGQGAVVYGGGTHQYNAFRRAALADDATVGAGANSRWDVRSQDYVGSFDFNGHTLTKIGSGLFSLSDVAVTTGDQPAGIHVKEGTFLPEQSTNLDGAQNTLTVESGAMLQLYRLKKPLDWTMDFKGGATIDTQDSYEVDNHLAGPMTLGAGTVTFQQKELYFAEIDSAVSGEGKLLKKGKGNLYLANGAKTYEGGTEIAEGRLYASAPDQIPGYDEGQVSVTGEKAGLVLQASGWPTADFLTLYNATMLGKWNSYIGYSNDTAEEVEITAPLAKTSGGLFLEGATAPLKATGGVNLPDGLLVASGDVTISAENAAEKMTSIKRIELYAEAASLTLTGGQTVKLGKTANVNDIVIGNDINKNQTLVIDNATVTVDPVNGASPGATWVGAANNSFGTLEIKAGGTLVDRILGANIAWARGAIFVRDGGTLSNASGSGNDGFIANQGYGYLQNEGTVNMMGWAQIVGSGNASAVGVCYMKGGALRLTGENGGDLDISRGGTGLIYQTGGTVEALKGNLNFNGYYSADRGLAIWTIEGANAVAKSGTFVAVNKQKTQAILNLREGGTIDYGEISPRASNFESVESQPFYINAAGGFLKPQKTGTLFKDGERYQPNKVVAFAGGLGFDIGEGIKSELNVPVSAPEGRGIKAIEITDDIRKEIYLGAPFVRITGDGYGATAVVIYDEVAKRVTGVKVTSPGCNYTTATVQLDGGRERSNTAFDAVVTLTDEGVDQACGGLIKKGAGKLTIPSGMLPAVKMPITLEGGILDLGGETVEASVLTLAGGRYTNGKIVADKVVSTANAFLPTGVLAENGTIDVQDGTLTVDTVGAGLLMTLVSCADEDGVDAVINGETEIDWTDALPVVDFNRANSQQGWGSNQVLAYKGYIWNRGTTDVTWTFAEHFDDGTHVLIDGVTVLKDMTWITTNLGRATLTPGAHSFEVRFAQKGGGAGPAGNTYHPEWPANTLAFGLAYESTDSYDITLYDHLTDLSSGEVFTQTAEGGSTFDADGLTVEAGAGVAFNGASQTLTYGKDLAFDAADLIAGTGTMTFENATVAFAEGTTVTIADFEDLCQDDKVNEYVLVEADGGFSGLANLTFANPAPKGWKYAVKNGKKLVLQRNIGFTITIR